MKKGT